MITLHFPCLSGWLRICQEQAFTKLRFQNRGHAEWSSLAGEGGEGTESKHPVAAPQGSWRPSCFPRDPSTARRPAFALAALGTKGHNPGGFPLVTFSTVWTDESSALHCARALTSAATNYRSHSPITKSSEPRMLTTSLIMWPGRIFGRMLRLMKLGLRIFRR